ncbi:hypothetical protein [Mycobacterium shimoidei]|uniref:hypothetical protein n=1 Tax=Mycobacterium shimoidei TaxID=29313 RepID=UPI00084842EA|nr:hypothetical protein [Mycobacterium shimoidei]MCV7257947.1 hypothetical protein [Mycobacterium shimoidei]ODR14112.1 hypothetical protein BHQ16_06650 [Mycobacterium shimoidei]ORW83992.1 hypothetical protein AWC26_00820 [Mycobacterium shimoidei]
MPGSSQRSNGDRLGQRDGEVQAAVRFAVLTAIAGMAFVVVAALWVSTCSDALAVDTVACGVPQRTLLAFGGPAMLLAGGIWAFVRTYRIWRDRGTWWAWQGAGWFLLTLMALTLTMGAPPIAGLAG